MASLRSFENALVRSYSKHTLGPDRRGYAILRYALSLARLTRVPLLSLKSGETQSLEQSTDVYRSRLHEVLEPCFGADDAIVQSSLFATLEQVLELVKAERKGLLSIFKNTLGPQDLDQAVRHRPLALALGGGGGACYVFLGAMSMLEEAGLRPVGMAGTSMGSILASLRARNLDFRITELKLLTHRLKTDKLFRTYRRESHLGLPGTLDLLLRNVFQDIFMKNGKALTLGDMAIPLRVAVSGIRRVLPEYDERLPKEDVDWSSSAKISARVISQIIDVAKWPIKTLYLGADPLSKKLNVIDAMGFSAAVPGIFHYDPPGDDKKARELLLKIAKLHNVSRFLDGGFGDNLPAIAAREAVQDDSVTGKDPFVLSLDAFYPRFGKHLLFVPLMRLAQERSRVGRAVSNCTISFQHVLSPAHVTPSYESLLLAVSEGREAMKVHIPYLQAMMMPIENIAEIG